jgi:hypothetical protein
MKLFIYKILKQVFCLISLLFFATEISIAQEISAPLSIENNSQFKVGNNTMVNVNNGETPMLVPPPCTAGTNNNFASAINLVINAAATSGTTCSSTLEVGENLDCNSAADQTVWYKFTATATTSYVQIVTTGSCYVGSAIWNVAALPTGNCHSYACQNAANGPLTEIYQLATVIGQIYYIQITYGSGGPCGNEGTFNINVQNAAPAGTISNIVPANANATCATAAAGCYLNQYNPTVAQVQAACTGYLATYTANQVNTQCFSFNVGNNGSGSLNIQEIVSSNCGPGNVTWADWTLYDASCATVSCGNLSSVVVSPVACNTSYTICWRYEVPGCTHTQTWPYVAWSSAAPPICVLPIELLYFNAHCDDGVVNLNWETLSETNNNYFKIGRASCRERV